MAEPNDVDNIINNLLVVGDTRILADKYHDIVCGPNAENDPPLPFTTARLKLICAFIACEHVTGTAATLSSPHLRDDARRGLLRHAIALQVSQDDRDPHAFWKDVGAVQRLLARAAKSCRGPASAGGARAGFEYTLLPHRNPKCERCFEAGILCLKDSADSQGSKQAKCHACSFGGVDCVARPRKTQKSARAAVAPVANAELLDGHSGEEEQSREEKLKDAGVQAVEHGALDAVHGDVLAEDAGLSAVLNDDKKDQNHEEKMNVNTPAEQDRVPSFGLLPHEEGLGRERSTGPGVSVEEGVVPDAVPAVATEDVISSSVPGISEDVAVAPRTPDGTSPTLSAAPQPVQSVVSPPPSVDATKPAATPNTAPATGRPTATQLNAFSSLLDAVVELIEIVRANARAAPRALHEAILDMARLPSAAHGKDYSSLKEHCDNLCAQGYAAFVREGTQMHFMAGRVLKRAEDSRGPLKDVRVASLVQCALQRRAELLCEALPEMSIKARL